MQINVMSYVDEIVNTCPDKPAFVGSGVALTFKQIHTNARSIGTFLAKRNFYKEPIVVFMSKKPQTVAAFFGVINSGNFYVPLDDEMPRHRIELIFKSLNPRAVICDADSVKSIDGLDFSGELFQYEEIYETEIDDVRLLKIRDLAIDIDPIYVVFTSGSTGVPKGVVACHRSVIDYIEQLSSVLKIDSDTIFGNQAPLYVDACLKELFPTFKFGATTYFVPKELFMFPVKLLEFLNENKINTICWVASALTLVSSFGTFKSIVPKYLRTIAFGSEVFPIKQLQLWREHLPQTRFINLYGPTEATGMSCYFEVNRDFALDEVIPIGRPFCNTEIILIEDNKRVTEANGVGEICIRGTALTLGYYNNAEKTSESFIQNPLVTAYPELIYLTGDLGRFNELGELVFVSRKDYQIKHMGHRIELGEIELALNMKDGISSTCCIFDNASKKIILYYVGDCEKPEVTTYLKEKLPRYMIPNQIFKLENMPLTPNGKIDRNLLKQGLS